MTDDDRNRLRLHRRLEEVLGPEEGAILMSHLPPVTWDQMATKDDLSREISELRSEMQVGFATVRTELATQLNQQTWKLMTVMVAWSSLMTAVFAIVS